MSRTVFAPGETAGAAELTRAGLLMLGEKVTIDATAVFAPADAEGTVRRIQIGSGARVGAYALIFVGASGFAAASRLAKGRRDLNGLLYADGIHDSLYRSTGRTLITNLTAGALLPDAPVPAPLAALEAD